MSQAQNVKKKKKVVVYELIYYPKTMLSVSIIKPLCPLSGIAAVLSF